jgi:hypothetical protein
MTGYPKLHDIQTEITMYEVMTRNGQLWHAAAHKARKHTGCYAMLTTSCTGPMRGHHSAAGSWQ